MPVSGAADMGFCNLWYDQTKIQSFDMSVFWSAVCLKFLFPRPKKLPTTWRNLFEPFNWQIWTLLFSCIVLQTLVLMWVSAYALQLRIISTRCKLTMLTSSSFFTTFVKTIRYFVNNNNIFCLIIINK